MRKSADLQRCFHVPGQPGPSTLSGLNGLNNVLEAGVCIVGRGGCVNRQKKGANVLAAGLLLWPVNVEASKVPTATQPGMRMLSCENLATAWGVQAACAPSMRTNPLAPPVKRLPSKQHRHSASVRQRPHTLQTRTSRAEAAESTCMHGTYHGTCILHCHQSFCHQSSGSSEHEQHSASQASMTNFGGDEPADAPPRLAQPTCMVGR